MNLEEIFSEIIPELDKLDTMREKILELNRKGIRFCADAIKKLHRREKGVSEKINIARDYLQDLINLAKENEDFNANSFYKSFAQEYVEAIQLQNIFLHKKIVKYSDIEPRIPVVSFLLGLCDVVGELRRACLDCIR
ncbi:MAG: hypothetical protein ACTSWN_02190, partial [Promethearchaeota archaeon]